MWSMLVTDGSLGIIPTDAIHTPTIRTPRLARSQHKLRNVVYARSVRELRVPIYVIRNARPTDLHFSFPSCHMIVVNPAI